MKNCHSLQSNVNAIFCKMCGPNSEPCGTTQQTNHFLSYENDHFNWTAIGIAAGKSYYLENITKLLGICF